MDLSDIEAELEKLADKLAAVRPDECLSCYLDRTIPQLGCRDLTLTKRWNAAQAKRFPRLLERLRSQGGFCDCEVVFNVLHSGSPRELDARLKCAEAFSA